MMRALFLASTAVLISPPALADVFVVGSGPGDYSTIHAALDAADPGDTILVRAGTYVGDVTVREGVHVVGDGPGAPIIDGRLRLFGQGSAGEVSCANLEVRGQLVVIDWSGPVLLQDLLVDYPGFAFWNGTPSASHLIWDCDRVVLQNCVLYGRDGGSSTDQGGPGDHALEVRTSDVALYGCRLFGGKGGDQLQSHYAASGGGVGGHALIVLAAQVWTAGTVHLGGMGGYDPWSGSFAGSGADLWIGLGGQVHSSLHARFFFQLPSLVREADAPNIVVYGPPGAPVQALVGTQPGWRDFNAFIGVLHLTNAFQVVPLGTIPASGQLTVPFTVPPLNGALAERRHVQLFTSTAQGRMLSDPRAWNLLDAQY